MYGEVASDLDVVSSPNYFLRARDAGYCEAPQVSRSRIVEDVVGERVCVLQPQNTTIGMQKRTMKSEINLKRLP